jgi:hypothetical protein
LSFGSQKLGIRKPSVKGGAGDSAEKPGSPAKRLPRPAGRSVKQKADRDGADLSKRKPPPFNRFSSRRPP